MEKRFARDVMTRDILTVSEDLPVVELARVLSENRVSGAPVLDKRNRLVGVVSLTDIVSNELNVGLKVVSDLEYYARPEIASRDELRGAGFSVEEYADSLVSDIMTPLVISAPPDATLAEVGERMAVNRVHRVIIADGDGIHGVVSALDLVGVSRAMAARRTTGIVLWATDLGSDSEVVGGRAISLAIESGARVVVLHVTPDLASVMRTYGELSELRELQAGFEETALAKLHQFGEQFLEGVVDYELIGRSGDPPTVIVEVLEQLRPSYVVLGAQRPPEARLRGLGSVAEKVLARSAVPVLVVPRP